MVTFRRRATTFSAALVAALALVGAWRSVMMRMPGTSALTGMPLRQMPEMFVAAGLLVVFVGLAPNPSRGAHHGVARQWVSPRVQTIALTLALVIDVSKTSSLGFVIPGLRREYGLAPTAASLLAVAGLGGATVGALLAGPATRRLGTRNAYLTACLAFTVTSMCGSMPSFAGNIVMCALMGSAVGILAPLIVVSLREINAGRPAVVLACSVLATALGYFLAAGTAWWLTPDFGWRVMWLVGAPTGVVIACLAPLLPLQPPQAAPVRPRAGERTGSPTPARAVTLLHVYALVAGCAAFGVSVWAPTMVAGASPGRTDGHLLLMSCALVPFAGVLSLLYDRAGPEVVGGLLAIGLGLALVALLACIATPPSAWLSTAALVVTLGLVNSMTALVLPAATHRITGMPSGLNVGSVSAANRVGGLLGPALLAPLVTSRSASFLAISVLAGACMLLSIWMLAWRAPATEPDGAPLLTEAPAPPAR